MFNYNGYKAEEEGREEIEFRQFLAGALLVFDKLDYIDLSMLVDEFESQENTWVSGYFSIGALPEPIKYNYFVEKKDRTIKFGSDDTYHNDYNLETVIRGDGRCLKEVLEETAGERICHFFKNINKEEFEKRKQEQIAEYKARALEETNILLISGNELEYKKIKEYGFKNIDWFDSILNADKYFLEHPEELDKFHMILKGDYPRRSEWNFLKSKLRGRGNRFGKGTCLVSDFTVFVDSKQHLHAYGYDEKGSRDLEIDVSSFDEYFDFLVGNLYINRLLERHNVPEQEFKQHEEYDNPDRLPLPTKKQDIKILYCPTIKATSANFNVCKALGLNVTIWADNNNTLDKILKESLGEYDIIIVSDLYSRSLLSWNKECTAQCRTTGRDLAMLVTFKDSQSDIYNEITHNYESFGTTLELRYNFGGRLAPSTKTKYIKFSSLTEDWEVTDEEIAERGFTQGTKENKKFIREKKSIDSGIIQAVTNLYNQALLNSKNQGILDLDLKSAEEIDKDYEMEKEKIKNKLKEEMAPIKAFDELILLVKKYLVYKDNGFLSKKPNGLIITEDDKVIRVSNVINNQVMCTIAFSQDYFKYYYNVVYTTTETEWLRIFDVQTLNKKGSLTSPQIVGVYTNKYEQVPDIPPRPDEKQANALYATLKKVQAVLIPILKEAEERPQKLNHRRRKNRRH